VRKNDINDTDPLADRDNRTVEVRISIAGEKAELLKHLIYIQVNVRINL
jgi:HlyD family secretion protein